MRTLRISGLVIILNLAATFAFSASRHEGGYLKNITTKVVTPHLQWARPFAGGRIKALFIVPRNLAAREIAELAQRLDLDFQAVTVKHASQLAIDNIYDGAVKGTSTYEKKQELLDKLKEKYQVIVLANFAFSALPMEARYRVLRQVAEGAGLVCVYPRRLKYKKVLARPSDAHRWITRLATIRGLPKEKLRSLSPDKLVRTYDFGKGRIALIDYQGYHSAYWGGLGLSAPEAWSSLWKARYENNMLLVIRAVLWAVGRAVLPEIVACNLAGDKPYAREDFAARDLVFSLRARAGSAAKLRVRVRDDWNRVVAQAELPVAFKAGQAQVKWRPPLLAAGRYYLDMILSTDKGVSDCGVRAFDIASLVGALKLAANKRSYEKQDRVSVTLDLEKPLPVEARVELALADSPYGRVWMQKVFALPAGRKQLAIVLDPVAIPTISGRLEVRLVTDAGELQKADLYLFFPQRDMEVFPTLVWDSVPEKYLSPFYAQQVVAALGWRAALNHPSAHGNNARVAAIFDQRFVPYMSRIGVGVQKDKKGWTKQMFFLPRNLKDKVKQLNGDESFYNPAVQELFRECTRSRIENLPLYGPLVYNLGDENHLSYEAGYSPWDEKAFRVFLRKRYGTIDALNRQWRTKAASFDEVKPLFAKDALAAKNFPAWFDHRLFVEHQYADIHHFLSQYIKDIDPRARVGAEGSVPGDLEYTISKLDFWGPYADPVMDEVLRSMAPDKLRTLWWGGYVGSHGGRGKYPLPLWRPLLAGTVNGSAWYSASIGSEGFLGVDFSYAKYFQKLKPHLMELQKGLAQLLVSTPLAKNGIAIHWSHASASICQADERFFNPKASTSAFIDFCYRHGLNFDFLTTNMIERGKLAPYKVLFLFGSSSITSEEQRQITAFAEAGGVVIADLNPGILNRFCRPLGASSLAELFGAPGLKGEKKLKLAPVSLDLVMRKKQVKLIAAKAFTSVEVPGTRGSQNGKGAGILLGFDLASAKASAQGKNAFDRFMLQLLSVAGIAPQVTVDGIDPQRKMVRLREAGDFQVLGILAAPADVGKTMTVNLPGAMYVYRAGHGLVRRAASWSAKLDTPFQVYCLFTTRQSPPVIRIDRAVIKRGQALALDTSVFPAHAVMRMELIDPANHNLSLRGRVLVSGELPASLPVRFAYSDKPGKYILRLTDVRTGLAQDAVIVVQ